MSCEYYKKDQSPLCVQSQQTLPHRRHLRFFLLLLLVGPNGFYLDHYIHYFQSLHMPILAE